MPKDSCSFRISGKECPNKRNGNVYCAEHKSFFSAVDNPTLIEETARAMRAMTYVSKDKKITAHADPNLIDAFTNRLQELFNRGYSREEALHAINDVIQLKGILDDQLKAIGQDPKWKKFEKIVAGIHMLQCEGADVKFDDHIHGKLTSSERQIDVSLRFTNGFYDYLTIVECKDTGRNVSIKEISDLSIKMEDVGAQHGVIVAAEGFQKGAIELAKSKKIETFTLKETRSDWTKQIKAEVVTLPWPAEIEFDYPLIDLGVIREQPIKESFSDIVFHKNADDPPIPLSYFLHQVITHVVETKLEVPCEVRVPFEPPLLCQLPGLSFYSPMYAIVVHLEPSRFAFGTEIDLPPRLVSYRYSDLKGTRVHDFAPKDIPPVK